MIRPLKTCLVFLVFAALSAYNVLAQGTYRSKDGSLSVTADYHGFIVTAHSKQVHVSLDYETSAFVFRLELADLHTGIDSLDRKLRSQNKTFILRGNFSLGEIETTQHPPRDFVFTASLETNSGSITKIKGTGRLEHIGGGEEMACELSAYFDTTANVLGIYSASNTNDDQQLVKVQFYKTVLKRY